ncbi:MAG: hypothetical protein ACRD1Y_09710, partial [Terriglobales bacterium]
WREAALAAIEAGLAEAPGRAELLFERAALFDALGEAERAEAAYLELLHRTPAHPGALINLGSLLRRRGSLSAALGEACGLGDDFSAVQKKLVRLRDNLLRNTRGKQDET